MANTHKAGCACGAVQLEITGDPTAQVYCHCSSCRGWLGAPIHAASLWPTPNVKVTKGADKLGLYKRTENSHRQFCTACGAPVLVGPGPQWTTAHLRWSAILVGATCVLVAAMRDPAARWR